MHFSTIIFTSLFAALSVNAQEGNSTVTTTSAAVSGTWAANPAQQSVTNCLLACAANDAGCRAGCLLLGNSVNPITDCQALCPKGNGTATENQKYRECVQGCISTAALAPSATSRKTSVREVTDTATTPTHSGVATGTATATGAGTAAGTATSTGTGTVVSLVPTSASGNLHLMHLSLCGCGILGVFAVMIVL